MSTPVQVLVLIMAFLVVMSLISVVNTRINGGK